ncbi:MAG: GAF and ANTAR domain-containing protein [Actinomycetota bacterium]|nr:GAF and ANTAR domain-containing protein [Actinomycetota bacterium]
MHDLPDVSTERLARVTRLLRTQRTLPAKLETVVALVKRTIRNCDAAGIILLIEGEPTTTAVSDRLVVEVDLVQYETGEGPCLAAISDSNVIRMDAIERDSRFSHFSPGALAHEVNSVLSMPLVAGGRAVGALNLYSHLANAFDGETEQAVKPMADYAAEAISSSPLYAYSLDMVDGLVETLESRALIAQATGVMIAAEHLSGEDALDRLRQLAMASGESLRTVADWVLEERPTGPLPAGQEELGGAETAEPAGRLEDDSP